MKLNLEMAKKLLDWHTLATKFLVASNGNLYHKNEAEAEYRKEAVGLTHNSH
jgi:hypothetical protein